MSTNELARRRSSVRRSQATSSMSQQLRSFQPNNRPDMIDPGNDLSESKDVVFGLGLAPQRVQPTTSSSRGLMLSPGGANSRSINAMHDSAFIQRHPEKQRANKVYFEQNDGTFVTQEQHQEQQRAAARLAAEDKAPGDELTILTQDDAITFEPFMIYFGQVAGMTLRMLTGLCAGLSLFLTIYLFLPSDASTQPIAIDSMTGAVIGNITIQGSYGTLCANSTKDSSDCEFIRRYTPLYKASSYFFLSATLVMCTMALMDFSLALAQSRPHLGRIGSDPQQQQQQQQPNTLAAVVNAAMGDSASEADEEKSASTDMTEEARRAHNRRKRDKRRRKREKELLMRRTPMGRAILVMKHVVLARFPLYVVCLICTIVNMTVELDRRRPEELISVASGLVMRLRVAIIARMVFFILAWFMSFMRPE